MPQPRSSLAMALQDYRGPRPGIALTIAAVALVIAMVVDVFHLLGLGRAAVVLADTQRTIQTLNRYNARLEVWHQMAAGQLEFEAQRRLRTMATIAPGRLHDVSPSLAASTRCSRTSLRAHPEQESRS